MTSIAQTELSTGRNLSLREADPAAETAASRVSRKFNLRAYLAGGAATTALIAGAILVFASLAAYVAFNGLPVGANDENASQLTVAAGSNAPEAAAAALGRAPGAVAAAAAAATATAPAPGSSPGGGDGNPRGGEDSNPQPPGLTPTDPGTPIGTAPTAPGGAATGGPVSNAVKDVSNATNLPLDGAAGGAAQQVDDLIQGVGGSNSGQTAGGVVNEAVGGAVQGVGNLVAP